MSVKSLYIKFLLKWPNAEAISVKSSIILWNQVVGFVSL